MKKLFSIIMLIALCVCLVACASTTSDAPSGAPATQPEEPQPSSEDTPKPTQKANDVEYEITFSNAKTYKNSIGTIWVQAIYVVKNIGANALYMGTGAYDLEDTSGALVKSSSMVSAYPQVIEPGEKAYYYEETTLEGADAAVELNILPRVKVEKAKINNIKYAVSDASLSDDKYGGVKMLGRVENTSSEAESMVYIVAILFNDKDEPIGQIFTILMEELRPGDKIGFEMNGFSLPDDVTSKNIARYDIFAYPMQMQF